MTNLPSLGPRGEGWLVIQALLLVAIAYAGTLGPAWAGEPRVAGVVIGAILIGLGAAMGLLGVRDLGSALTPLPYPREEANLVDTGIYGHVRHPIYGGLIVASLGWGLATASPAALALAAVLLGFFSLKARREEAWLASRFPTYPAYRARTRALLPFIY